MASLPALSVINTSGISASAPSADDWADSYEGGAVEQRPDLLWYRPSGYYARRELRDARTLDKACTVAACVLEEIVELDAWARSKDCNPRHAASAYVPLIRAAVSGARSLDDAVQIGLHLCTELEQLQRHVTDAANLIPPRWVGTQSEIIERGLATA